MANLREQADMAQSKDERNRRIYELNALGWPQRKIATALGCAQSTVGAVLSPDIAERKRTRDRTGQRKRYWSDPERGRERARARRAADPEKDRGAARRWYLVNRELVLSKARDNPVPRREAMRRRYWADPVAARQRNRAYYRRRVRSPAQLQRERERVRQWQRDNPVNMKAIEQRRRNSANRGMDRVDRLLSVEYRKAIARDLCIYCGSPGQHVDHKFPVARGGTDHWWNLQRTCQRCNHRKGTKTHDEFVSH